MIGARDVALNEKVLFRCQMCSQCCRDLENRVMLEPIDIYYLTRYLREQGKPVIGPEDMLADYARAIWLEDVFPIFTLNTVGELNDCIFLKEGRCSVYEARPHVCRMYPFSAAPGEKGRNFRYLLCTERPYHFSDGIVIAKDWFSQNFSKETRDALKADYDALPTIGQDIRDMGKERFKKHLFQFLYFRYYNYELDEPFLPQFLSNLEKLKKLTGGQKV